MPAVAALLESPSARLALRRTLSPSSGTSVLVCRSPENLERQFHRRPLDAVVVGLRALETVDLTSLRARYPGVPIVAYAGFRTTHGPLLADLLEKGRIATVLVEGVDDAVAGDLVRRCAASRAREAALGDATRLLRLTEPIQRRTWEHLVAGAGRPVRVADLARQLDLSREHLSRQFAAGGAPTLKRVIDLVRIACAAQLLGNPGYDPAAAARILGFASPSHLNVVTRRVTGEPVSRLRDLGPRGVLQTFVSRWWDSRGSRLATRD